MYKVDQVNCYYFKKAQFENIFNYNVFFNDGKIRQNMRYVSIFEYQSKLAQSP